jgi:hypothetical protein
LADSAIVSASTLYNDSTSGNQCGTGCARLSQDINDQLHAIAKVQAVPWRAHQGIELLIQGQGELRYVTKDTDDETIEWHAPVNGPAWGAVGRRARDSS